MSTVSEKKIHFITGLPRSGSTLMCNILSQNPKFYASSTSALMPLLLAIRDRWSNLSQSKASEDHTLSIRLMRGMMNGFFSNVDNPVCFDKGRGWSRHIEMTEEVMGHKTKMIVMVRDIRDVLASFETLWRKNVGHRTIPQERTEYEKFSTIEGRLSVFMDNKEVVGASYNYIRDAVHRGFNDRLLFVDFDSLTRNPENTMRQVYEFLGEEYYEHNFNNVEQVVTEKDEYYGFDDLHTIRPKVEPVESRWREVLGEKPASLYSGLNFWNNPDIVAKLGLNIIKNK